MLNKLIDNHLLRKVDTILDLNFVYEQVKDKYCLENKWQIFYKSSYFSKNYTRRFHDTDTDLFEQIFKKILETAIKK